MRYKHFHLVLISLVAVGVAIEFFPPSTRATWVPGQAKIIAASLAAASADPVSAVALAQSASPASSVTPAQPVGGAEPLKKTAEPARPLSPSACSVVPPGTQCVPHMVKRNESVGAIVSHYLAETVYMRRAELDAAVRQANGLGRQDDAQARRRRF